MILLFLLAQITPVQPIVKGTGLPPAVVTEETGVLVPIDALFAGLAARDPQAILAAMRPDAGATVAEEKPDGTRSVRHMTAREFAAMVKPGPERYAERITDPAIEIDGDIAMVWAPYVFTIDGKPAHCGYDHFDLVRENARWKIQSVTWSSRTTGCAAQ
jgi:ketosteroid isomerase-like protein